MASLIPSGPVATGERPVAEAVVDGELSPFEHEALYRILRKSFRVEQPSYRELVEEDLATRVNVIFHHPYTREFFTDVLQDGWRDLKELFQQVTYRRGRAGAAFTFTFVGPETRLVFKSGTVGEKELGSALDQIGHLTGIVRRMLLPEKMQKPMVVVEAVYDKKSDRWNEFQGSSSTLDKYIFDESTFRWVLVEK